MPAERLTDRYDGLAASGEIAHDPSQYALAERFDALNARLAERRAGKLRLGRLLAGRGNGEIKGLYVHGEVGRGKTWLMDEFFALAVAKRKRRAHFNEFMADVHERIHVFRQKPKENGKADPIVPVATAIAAETRLLCLDEFQVGDIADAMILSRLFGQLFERGLVLVATSNSPPDELYRNGLNRALFLPFIALLKRHSEIVDLRARVDFRLEKLGAAPVYVTPLGRPARLALDRAWRRLTGAEHGAPVALPMKGRAIKVPEAAKGVARFSFAELCEQPLGASDFLRIARAFHTVLVDDIPVMPDEARNEARRFIALIDELYDNRVKLVASAAAEPAALYPAKDGEEAFAFKRTVSRLIEMGSDSYLAAPHGTVVARS